MENKNIKKLFLLKYLEKPKLKLTDFGLMKKGEVNETTNARNYRCPKIILGYKCDKELENYIIETLLSRELYYKQCKIQIPSNTISPQEIVELIQNYHGK